MSSPTPFPSKRKSFGIRKRIDIIDYYRQEFIKYTAEAIPDNSLILDAAAGDCPDRTSLAHTRYQSCDWQQNSAGLHHFLCDLRTIPVPDAYYDAVLCILALDDAVEPQAWMNEFARILKPGGSLFITAPLNGRIHNPPYHYYHFSPSGLSHLAANAHFEVRRIHAWGGIFSCLSHFCHSLTKYIRRQYPVASLPVYWRIPLSIVLLPLLAFSVLIFQWIIPLICFYADRMDRERQFTLGHDCHFIKMI